MNYSQLYLSGGTDLQRLLNNVKPDTPRPRQCGRTYSTLLLMAGQPFYGVHNSIFLYVGESDPACITVKYEFMELMKFKGLNSSATSPSKSMCFVTSTNQKFIFASVGNWEIATKGYTIEMAFLDTFYTPAHTNILKDLYVQAKHIHIG